MSVENQDLQTYLDYYNKEMDEVSLNADTVAETLSGADAVAQKMLREDDQDEDDASTDYDTYCLSSKDNKIVYAEKTETVEVDDDFLLIVNKRKTETYNEDSDNPDDPSSREVYEFDENETVVNDDTLLEPKVYRLKPTVNSNKKTLEHRCKLCSFTTHKGFLLSRHLKTHSEERPFKCSVCERGFKTNAALLNHVNTHLGNKPYPCKSCDARFTTSGELVRHVRYRHTGEKPHKCTECEYSSVELSKLRRHMRCHTGERPYQCPHCTYASPDSFKLKRHIRTHTGEKPYECDICQARFTQSNSLKAHHLIHSVGDKPVFQCSLCPTTCGRKTDLRLHTQKLHHSEHPIKCKRCGKEFPDRYTYKVHIKTHEGEKCFRCEVCPYACATERHLEAHMLIHTDEKPFVCEYCFLAFRQRQLLRRHINLYHTANYTPPIPRPKTHRCPHCNRSFTHKGNLMRHMELHDPDSGMNRIKLQLKLGRLHRVHRDTSDATQVSHEQDNAYGTESEEDYEIIETADDEDEQKPTVSQNVTQRITSNSTPEGSIAIKRAKVDQDWVKSTKIEAAKTTKTPIATTVKVKKEDFMAVEGDDGQQYMVVEVLQCDDEEDDDENCVTVENVDGSIIELQAGNEVDSAVNTCFGFVVDENPEFLEESPESKEQIQLVDIIEEE